jgi:tetratricopeptide (TPR) repeat protein
MNRFSQMDYPGEGIGVTPSSRVGRKRISWEKKVARFKKKFFSNKKLGNLLWWSGKFLLLLLCLKILIDVVPQLGDKKYYLKTFSVPESLSQYGISGQEICERILINITNVDSIISRSSFEFSHVSNEYNIQIEGSADLEYEGISYKRLVNFLIEILSPKKIISGSVVVEANKMICHIKISDKNNSYWTSCSDSLMVVDKVDIVSTLAAHTILSQLSPIHYATYTFCTTNYKKTISLCQKYLYTEKDNDKIASLYSLIADSHKNMNDDKKAKEYYLLSASMNNQNYYAFANITYGHLLHNELDSAKKYLLETSNRIPNRSESIAYYNNLKANYSYYNNQHDSSLIYYQAAVRYDSSNFYYLSNIAAAFATFKQYDSSYKYYKLIIERFPGRGMWDTEFYKSFGFHNANYIDTTHSNPHHLFTIGLNLFDGDNYDSADSYFIEAITKDSFFVEPLFFHGVIKSYARDYIGANAIFEKCTEINGTNRDIIREWVLNLIEQGDMQKAMSLISTYQVNDDDLFLSDFGYAYAAKGNYLKAQYFYLLSDIFNSTNTVNLNRLARLKYNTSHYLESVSFHNRIIEIDPTNLEAMQGVADCYLKLGRWKDAENISKKVIIHSSNASSFCVLARAALNDNNEKRATIFYLKAYELDNHSTEAITFLATMYTRQGKFGEAIKWWLKLENLTILNAEDLLSFGVCYSKSRMHRKAIEYYKRATGLEPNLCIALRNWFIGLQELRRDPTSDFSFRNALASSSCREIEQWILSQGYKL